MQVVILAGGTGTRLREQTEFLPKPLVQIGGKPMVWHIMKIYAHYGFTDFVLALGYKQEIFKEYFKHFFEINNDVTMHIGNMESVCKTTKISHRWCVTLSDTGLNTMKGARLKQIERYIKDDTFMCTYGDGLSDVDLRNVLAFHKSHGKIATITGVHPVPRFGEIYHKDGLVQNFLEKPQGECLMNGGFMVFNRGIFDYLSDNSSCDLETDVFNKLTTEEEIMVYPHTGFWKCMDTLKEMDELQQMWDEGKPKWRVWDV